MAASDLAVAAIFFRMFQATNPKPDPIARNGSIGSPGKTERTSSTPLERNSGWGLPKICFWTSVPKRSSVLARVTIIPPEMDIMRAGITVTRPSPMVRVV